MDTLFIIVIEFIGLMIIGIPVTYLIWRLGGKKDSFGEFINKYGYGIAVISFIILGVIFASIRTAMQE